MDFMVVPIYIYIYVLELYSINTLFTCSQCLRLSKAALNEISPGQIVNLVSNDVSRFDAVAVTMNYLWTAPIVTLLICYFLYSEVGLAGFSGMLIIGIIAPLQGEKLTFTTRWNIEVMSAMVPSLDLSSYMAQPHASLVQSSRVVAGI